MGEVIDLPKNEGNGAREAVAELLGQPGHPDFYGADVFLIRLWLRGFKVVPFEPER